jgi:MscS family membrane protein
MPRRPAYRRSLACRRKVVVALLLALAWLGLPTTVAFADVTAATNGEAATPEKPAEPEVPAEMRTPQAALEAFIKRMQANEKGAAAELLDLSQLSAVAIDSRGPDLAYKLYRIFPAIGDPPTLGDGEAMPWYSDQAAAAAELDFSKAESNPEYDQPWSIKDWLRYPAPEAEQITIARDGANRWRFSAETVAVIDPLYEQFEEKIDELTEERAKETAINGEPAVEAEPTQTMGVWMRKQFPQSWRTTHFLLPSYQWLLLLVLIPLGFVVDWVTRVVLTSIGDLALRRLDPDFDEERKSTDRVWRPVGRLAHAALWVFGARLIELSPTLTSVLLTVLMIVTIVAAVLALFAVLDLVKDYMQRKAKRTNRRFDDLFLPLANTTAKIAVGILGVIATIAVFNKQLPAALLGGLGIGGIAIALASQETLSNFLGSVTLLFDRPFEVGDRVIVDNIDGTVESLGFRSTRIRTGLDSEVTLPNSKLASSSVNNFGRRKYRQYAAMLGVEYSTAPEQIDAFCEGIRELIRRHPHTRKDFYAAYLHDFGANSLDIKLLVFFETPDYATELRERHRLLIDVLRLAASLGVSFAFPTQTLYLQKGEKCEVPDLGDDPPDLSGAKAAAKIAGELPNYQDRPGPVKFTGARKFD